MLDLVRNPEDRFSHNEAQVVTCVICFCVIMQKCSFCLLKFNSYMQFTRIVFFFLLSMKVYLFLLIFLQIQMMHRISVIVVLIFCCLNMIKEVVQMIQQVGVRPCNYLTIIRREHIAHLLDFSLIFMRHF